MDRVISVDDGAGITRFTYYDNGSRKSVLYPDGSSETYVYDANGQNTALVNRKADNTLIDTYTYTYDAANHQTSKTDEKGQTTFTYDKLGRLATITEPSGIKTAYTYDKAGNRTGEKKYMGEVLTQDTQYRYDASNRLLSTETKSQVLGTTDRVAYTYDANGNMLSQMTTSIKPAEIGNQATFVLEKSGASPNTLTRYTYDGFNQLKTSDDGTNKITYAYNGLGYRVEKSVTTGPTESPVTRTSRYLYEYDKVVLEVDAAGNEIAKNTYGTNLLSREMADITVYYMYNGHGDVTALLNTAGDTVATYYYDVWGNILEKMESASVSNPFRYAGYQYDEETDLYYLNARYYDAKIARFLTEDTYTGRQNDPLSLNLYTYCHNEPVMYKDPSGHAEAMDKYIDKNTEAGAIAFDKIEKASENWAMYDSQLSKIKDKDSAQYDRIKKLRESQHKAAENARAEYADTSGDQNYNLFKYGRTLPIQSDNPKDTNDPIQTSSEFNGVNEGTKNIGLSEKDLRINLGKLIKEHLNIVEENKNLGFYSTNESIDIILKYNETISAISKELGVPKAMIQAVLFKEIRMKDARDIAADSFVIEYFRYNKAVENYANFSFLQKLLVGAPQPASLMRDDSSTGLGQIFAKTAINAYNAGITRGDISGNIIDYDDLHQREKVWLELRDDEKNIFYVGLVLKQNAEILKIDLNNVTDIDIEKILARYNGFGDAASEYGIETKEYYDLFVQFDK